jgi:hypothetical protein
LNGGEPLGRQAVHGPTQKETPMRETTDGDIRALHERMGRVWHQPVPVASFTNKRVTINFRVPLEQVRRLLPTAVEPDEIGTTGRGMVSMCACDFWVRRIGPVPMPEIHTNEMLCRISAKVQKRGRTYRAYYTLRSDASSRFLGFLGGHFSHFRKAISQFTKRENEQTYELVCRADDPICGGRISINLKALSKDVPTTSVFADNAAATDFVLGLDGSCGYDYRTNRLSLQKIKYPAWDTKFAHRFTYELPLLDYLFEKYRLDAQIDHALFMENVPQEWGASFLYSPDERTAPIEVSVPA